MLLWNAEDRTLLKHCCENLTFYNIISAFQINKDGSFLIKDIQHSDEGNYSCSVENVHGSDEIVYSIRVLGMWQLRLFLDVTDLYFDKQVLVSMFCLLLNITLNMEAVCSSAVFHGMLHHIPGDCECGRACHDVLRTFQCLQMLPHCPLWLHMRTACSCNGVTTMMGAVQSLVSITVLC
jgi:hypothetical protein